MRFKDNKEISLDFEKNTIIFRISQNLYSKLRSELNSFIDNYVNVIRNDIDIDFSVNVITQIEQEDGYVFERVLCINKGDKNIFGYELCV